MTQKEIRMPVLSFSPPHVDVEGRMRLWDLDLDLPQLPGNAFGIARFSVAPGCTSPVDRHLSHEIWIVVSGEGELLYDGRITRLAQNDACYIQPQESHQVRNDGAVDFIAISIWWR
jgi:methionyl-tRNA synthetase